MSPTQPPLKRAAVALVFINALTVAVVVVCFESARHSQERSEEAVVSLANDMTQVSQAHAAAERMVAIGRAYLLANEPEVVVGERRRHLLSPMAVDHHDSVCAEPAHRIDDVLQQWSPPERVHHLGGRGIHARPLAGGEDDDVEAHGWLGSKD